MSIVLIIIRVENQWPSVDRGLILLLPLDPTLLLQLLQLMEEVVFEDACSDVEEDLAHEYLENSSGGILVVFEAYDSHVLV